jgi:hypothetical protein
MKKRERDPAPDSGESELDLSHLRREMRTALELAVVTLAPGPVTDRLAAAAGLLEALVELPPNSPPVIALVPRVVKRSKDALERWQTWRAKHPLGGKA